MDAAAADGTLRVRIEPPQQKLHIRVGHVLVVNIKEEVAVRDLEADAAIAMLLRGGRGLAVCHPRMLVGGVCPRGRSVGRNGNFRLFALPGLVVPAEPYFLCFQLVHVHPASPPSCDICGWDHSFLLEAMTSHSRNASTGIRILVPIRTDGNPSDFARAYAFGSEIPNCADSS